MRRTALLALGFIALQACAPSSEPQPEATDDTASVTPTDVRLEQEGGQAWWSGRTLPQPPEAAEEPAEDDAPDERTPRDQELAALASVAASTAQAPPEPGAAGWHQGQGTLSLGLLDRQESAQTSEGPTDARAPFASRDTQDRIRLDLVLSVDTADGEGHEVRLEPIRAIRSPEDPDAGSITVDAHRIPVGWTGWMLANVVVDGRTLDTDHLVHVSARPSGQTVPQEPGVEGPPAPLYAVQLVVMPVTIGGTVPELDALDALGALGVATEEGTPRQVLHLVFPEARIAPDPPRG